MRSPLPSLLLLLFASACSGGDGILYASFPAYGRATVSAVELVADQPVLHRLAVEIRRPALPEPMRRESERHYPSVSFSPSLERAPSEIPEQSSLFAIIQDCDTDEIFVEEAISWPDLQRLPDRRFLTPLDACPREEPCSWTVCVTVTDHGEGSLIIDTVLRGEIIAQVLTEVPNQDNAIGPFEGEEMPVTVRLR